MSLKMAMVVYNEALDMEIMEAMNSCGLKNYTKVMGVFGRGEASGSHLGNDIWPGKNNILYIICEERQISQLLPLIKELRKKIGHEGVKAFVSPVEEIT
jgi:nitrogen regulatory protein PII